MKYNLRLLIGLCCLILYLAIGAIIFRVFELPRENNARKNYVNFLEGFLGNHSCISTEDLFTFGLRLLRANQEGVVDLDHIEGLLSGEIQHEEHDKKTSTTHEDDDELGDEEGDGDGHGDEEGEEEADDGSVYTHFHETWKLPSAFFFSFTVITTIGYGNMTPRTIEGQVFCVIYAIFGIPLMGFVLSTVYKGVLNFFKYAIRNFAFCRRSHKETSIKHRLIILFIVLLSAFTVLVLVPAVMFKFFEGWNFWEATYYCFITISTIGFGDYVVGNYPDHSEQARWIIKIGAVMYITMGLSFMMALGKIAENEFRRTGNRRKAYRIKMRNSGNRPNSNSSNKKICADGSVWTVKDTRYSAPLCTLTETDRISNGGDIINMKNTDPSKQSLVTETAFDSKNCNENDRSSSSKKSRTRKKCEMKYDNEMYDEPKQEEHMAFSVSSLMFAANAFDDS